MTCHDTGRARNDDMSPLVTGLRLTNPKRWPAPGTANTVRDGIGPAAAERESITPIPRSADHDRASQGEAEKLFKLKFSARIERGILAVVSAG
jgi:hypothetical protein